MKKIILLFAFAGMIFGANAQKIDGVSGKNVKNLKLAPTTTKATCDTLNPVEGDSLTIYITNQGYLFGVNEYGTESSGEFFTYTGTGTQLGEMYVYFYPAYNSGNNGNITFNVYEPLNDTTPGSLLATQQLPISQIVADVDSGYMTHVIFDTPASISGNFIITIDNPTNGDTISIVSNQDGNSTPPDEALIKYNGSWYSAKGLTGLNVSLAIFPIICEETTAADNAELTNVVIYPTLTNGKVLFGGVKNATVEVYDVTGNKVAEFHNVTRNINIANLNNGIYILKVSDNGKVLNKKIVLQK